MLFRSQLLPPWMPAVGLEGGRINIVPVDFVVKCIDFVSHSKAAIKGRAFHLVDPQGYRVGDVSQMIATSCRFMSPSFVRKPGK